MFPENYSFAVSLIHLKLGKEDKEDCMEVGERKNNAQIFLFVSLCLFWKMRKKGSLSFVEEISFEMTLKVRHTIYDIFSD